MCPDFLQFQQTVLEVHSAAKCLSKVTFKGELWSNVAILSQQSSHIAQKKAKRDKHADPHKKERQVYKYIKRVLK
jgi:hypothetical protein